MSRIVSRAAMLLVVLAGAITCSESPTNLRRVPVHLAFAPQFSRQAASIYKSLSSFGLTIDNVHVVVRALGFDTPGPVLVDTTVAFPESASEVTIDIDVSIEAQQQQVVATVGLRQAQTTYFEGTQSFVATQGETTTAPEPVELSYVGPGATAEFMSIDPGSPTLAPSSSFQFAAHVYDPTEHPVTDLPLTWSTSDASIATVSSTGLVTSTAKTGSVTLTVTGLNGISQQATISVQPVATLVVQSGADQSGTVGSTLPTPFQVQAFDATQQPVIGAPITFAAVSGAGTVSPATATTDAQGYASTTLTLGSAAGSDVFTAAASGTQALTRIAVTATAAVTASLGLVSGNQQVDTVLATLAQPLTVRVTDSFGNAVANQSVDFRVTSGQAGLSTPGSVGSLPDLQVPTGADGTASVTLVAGPVAGAVQVAASIPGSAVAAVTFDETLRAGAPMVLAMVQQPSPTAQATITLGRQPSVRVTDLYGNPVAVAGVPVVVAPTVDCGVSACERVVPPRSGSAPLSRAPIGSVGARRRTLVPQRPRLTPTAPSASRITAPTRISMTQSVSDTFPTGLGGTSQVLTDASGVASFVDLSLNLWTGTWQLVFSDTTGKVPGAVSSSGIVLSPGPAESIVAFSADTTYNFYAGDTLYPYVRVIDKVGNGIPGVAVMWSVSDGSSKLDSLSQATHTDANGTASPGNWLTPVGNPNMLEITATPNPSTLENSPLHLYALPLPAVSVGLSLSLSGSKGSGGVTSSPAGIACSISPAGGPTGTCTTTFPLNQGVVLTEAPTGTSVFGGWGGACSSMPVTSTTCQLTMNAALSATALFNPGVSVGLTLTGTSGRVVAVDSATTATVLDCSVANGQMTGTCSANVASGTNLTLTETPGSGVVFAGWGGACQVYYSGATCSVQATASTSITAAFR